MFDQSSASTILVPKGRLSHRQSAVEQLMPYRRRASAAVGEFLLRKIGWFNSISIWSRVERLGSRVERLRLELTVLTFDQNVWASDATVIVPTGFRDVWVSDATCVESVVQRRLYRQRYWGGRGALCAVCDALGILVVHV
ncbi:hypothetical protein F2Q69_00015364 [Brassica cretica]|uniref:Uncharacterized protein n=1 Tax=Brassica cretica TaxID=69181 RepID=A0A8S9QPK3_BRACR|nr:hypothetical protein F2Q69_00015364 [Brassica cretica]